MRLRFLAVLCAALVSWPTVAAETSARALLEKGEARASDKETKRLIENLKALIEGDPVVVITPENESAVRKLLGGASQLAGEELQSLLKTALASVAGKVAGGVIVGIFEAKATSVCADLPSCRLPSNPECARSFVAHTDPAMFRKFLAGEGCRANLLASLQR
jgi:hypothetical protein